MRTIVSFTLCFIIMGHLAFSQSLPNLIPPSPNAAALAKYADIPVSLFSGTPNIEIPIGELSGKNIQLPVSLSYHAGGIKVSEVASWAGLGWALNAGGVVTRTIKGKKEYVVGGNMVPARNLPLLNNSTSADWSNLNNMASSSPQYDSEPDVFYFNFNGHSGSFYYNGGTKPIICPYADIDITFNYDNTQDGDITSFRIITEDGTKYFFNATEKTGTTSTPPDPTAWYLTRIENASGTEYIQLEYDQESYTYDSPGNYYELWAATGGVNNLVKVNVGVQNACNVNTIFGQRLKRITSSGFGTVEFTPGTTARTDIVTTNSYPLTGITIKDANGNTVKQFTLDTKIVNAADTHNPNDPYSCAFATSTAVNYRLYLDGVYQTAGGQQLQGYKFTYAGRTYGATIDGLPNRLSYAHDYWGYYNGQTSNNTPVPHFNGAFDWSGWLPYTAALSTQYILPSGSAVSVPGAYQDASETECRYGSLIRLDYPTGLERDFIYELHDNPDPNFVHGGGLRIKQIVTKDGSTTLNDKRYTYEGVQLGYNIDNISYTYFVNYTQVGLSGYNTFPRRLPSSGFPDDGAYPALKLGTASSTELGAFSGPMIGYSFVTESEPGNGYSRYSYLINSSYDNDFPVYTYLAFSVSPPQQSSYIGTYNKRLWYQGLGKQTSYYRGILKEKEVYNGAGIKLIDQLYDYSLIERSTIPGLKFEVVLEDQGSFNYSPYQLISGWARLNQETVSTLYNGSMITTTKAYNYGNSQHIMPTTITQSSSNSDTWITQYKYPHDFVGQQPYTYMVNTAHIWSPVIEQLGYKNSNSATTFLQSTKTDYQEWNGSTDQIYPVQISTKKGANNYEPRVQYLGYDNKGNVQSVSKVSGPQTVYIWSYGGEYPVAKIENVTYSAVETALGGSAAVATFRDSSPTDAQVNTFLTPLRNPSILPNSLITTYTYAPLVGMTSMTDAKGEITTYEYDNFQRLMNIKDKDGNIVKHMDYHYQNQ